MKIVKNVSFALNIVDFVKKFEPRESKYIYIQTMYTSESSLTQYVEAFKLWKPSESITWQQENTKIESTWGKETAW